MDTVRGECGAIHGLLVNASISAQEKAVAGFKALSMYEAEAKERQRAAGIERVTNADRDESGQLVPALEQAGEPLAPAPKSIERAASAFGVGKQYISDVKAISRRMVETVNRKNIRNRMFQKWNRRLKPNRSETSGGSYYPAVISSYLKSKGARDMNSIIDLNEKREERRVLQETEEQWQRSQAAFLMQHPEYDNDKILRNALNGVVILLANSPEYADKPGRQILDAAHEEVSSRIPERLKQTGLLPDAIRLTTVFNDHRHPLTFVFNAGFQRIHYIEALQSAIKSIEGGSLEGGIEAGDDTTLRRGDWKASIKVATGPLHYEL